MYIAALALKPTRTINIDKINVNFFIQVKLVIKLNNMNKVGLNRCLKLLKSLKITYKMYRYII